MLYLNQHSPMFIIQMTYYINLVYTYNIKLYNMANLLS